MKPQKNTHISDPLISILLLMIVWQLYISKEDVPAFILPSPLDVLKEIMNQVISGNIWFHIFVTGFETIIGFLMASLFGLIVGYFIYKNETIRLMLMPFLIFFQAAPKIALVPIFIIWFGLGLFSKLFVVFSMVFFPIVIGMIDGMNAIPKDMYNLMKILNADRSQVLKSLEIPYALPSIFAALKVGIVQAIIGATVAEWMSGQNGLGYIQTYASSTFNTPLLIAGIFFTIILGLLFYAIIEHFEAYFLSWNKSGDQK
ncbi:ABC transporter permease [Enterococcus gallinarum]|uniref:ABC transporter permease n=1 Tax=Enterococcus gallinarum TaxID=1353 RepID=UPI001F59DBAF|nr:ABC transporter permease [Enterococcus gallinarum]